jgi:CheY-like chemotaxis protein
MPPHRRLLVLVIDDHRDMAESLTMLLRLWGHEAIEAHDGRAALEMALTRRPDVVLLDLGLPGLSGHEVARRLRAQPGTKDILIWALTGHAQEEDHQRSRAAGCDLHLVKPLAPDSLRELLEDAGRAQAPLACSVPHGV